MVGPLIFITTILSNEPLLDKARQLTNVGTVMQQDTYLFLKVDDGYIHELYALLKDTAAAKPDYFSSNRFWGAHISIIYPEENIQLNPEDVGQEHTFSIKNLSHVILGPKEYFVLMVSAPSLNALRRRYGLPERPYYKGVEIDFHITIAVQSLQR